MFDNKCRSHVIMGVSLISTAGCIAQAMGLPVTFIAAVNANDIVGRTINSGDFSKVGDVHSSLSSAMDIQVSRSIIICSGLKKKKKKNVGLANNF